MMDKILGQTETFFYVDVYSNILIFYPVMTKIFLIM